MAKMKIELLDSFRTGHAGIDADHEQLVEIINLVSDAISEGELMECKKLLSSFMQCARDHFEREEKILFETKFPGAVAHAAYHHNLLGRSDEVRQLCEEMAAANKLEKCFEEMAGFFIDDVVKGDSQFVSHLIEKGLVRG